MVSTIKEAIDYLYRYLRKVTATFGHYDKRYYEVDRKKYNEVELIKLANSTNPATWFRS
jgi:hypothetical protein